MRLGHWQLASGNVVEVVVTIGAGDKPTPLDARCEWESFPPSPEDVAEYLAWVQPAIGEALAGLVKGNVLMVNV
jgi:hypothetical protein